MKMDELGSKNCIDTDHKSNRSYKSARSLVHFDWINRLHEFRARTPLRQPKNALDETPQDKVPLIYQRSVDCE